MASGPFFIGVDFGTDSVRAVLLDGAGGEAAARAEPYPRWSDGLYCDAGESKYRQHPRDYLEALEGAVRGVLRGASRGASAGVKSLGVCATGSTAAPLDEHGSPLSLNGDFEGDPDAMFALWKDHTAVEEAESITRAAKLWKGCDFTAYSGGAYSSEWIWAKASHALRNNDKIRSSARSWAELCDWIPFLLAGVGDPARMRRGRCPAGHKALWHENWGGYPPEEFFVSADPLLREIRRTFGETTYTPDTAAGGLTGEWAARLGLAAGTALSVGTLDAHAGAVASGVRQGTLSLILGTSADYLAVASREIIGDVIIKGICGQVDGSIVPGMIGFEAAQSAFGDLFRWFKRLLSWPFEGVDGPGGLASAGLKSSIEKNFFDALEEAARAIPLSHQGPAALDWLNGRNSPDVNERLKGAMTGLTGTTTAVDLYRALVEAAVFGAKAIVRRFAEEGLSFTRVVASGGVAKKSPYIMQALCDVLETPIDVMETDYGSARGAAMFGAVAAGMYRSVPEAQERITSPVRRTYLPIDAHAARYRLLYDRYLKLGSILSAK